MRSKRNKQTNNQRNTKPTTTKKKNNKIIIIITIIPIIPGLIQRLLYRTVDIVQHQLLQISNGIFVGCLQQLPNKEKNEKNAIHNHDDLLFSKKQFAER